MNEAFKDLKFYNAPKVVPRAPIPPAPKKAEDAVKSNIFINEPKSLPTDLTRFERPRQYHERLKQLTIKAKPPTLRKSKASDQKLTFRSCNLYGAPKALPNVECHLMIEQRKAKPLISMKDPLTMVRKPVSDSVDQADNIPGNLTKAELKQIAPDGGAVSNKRHAFQKKTRQVFEHDKVAREERRREANPWILEDADGKEQLRGIVEQGSRARYVAMVMRKNGGFDIRPVRRLYKFDPPPKYHVPNAAESEALLNAKKIDMNKWFSNKNAATEEDGPRLKTVERGDDKRPKKRADAEDADELDYDEDFQDDEEMGMGDEYEETKEVGERDRKRQNRLNPASSSSDSSSDDSDQEAPSKPDHTVKRLKKMVGADDLTSSDEDDDAPKPVIRKMEVPKPVKVLPKEEASKVLKPLPKKEASYSAPAQIRNLSTNSDNLDPKLLTPNDIARIVKSNPEITMKQLALKLKLNLVKWNSEQKKKFMDMLYSVVFKPKDEPYLKLHKAYQ